MSGITCSGTTQRSDMHACSLQHITCVIAMQLPYAGRSLQSHDVSSAVACDRQSAAQNSHLPIRGSCGGSIVCSHLLNND